MFQKGRNTIMATTTEVNKADRAALTTLMTRGGPFTPGEFSRLSDATPAELAALRFRTVGPQHSPEELEVHRRVEEKFGAKRVAAESELAAAIAAREVATEKMFTARDALAAVSSATFITGGWGGGTYERGGTPEQTEAAQAVLEDAQQELKSARQREADARVRLTTLGAKRDAYARELQAERALNRKK